MASNNFKQFLDRNESVINTTGHLVSFFQNNKIAKNQKALAQLELVNTSLIEKQNRIREKELEKLEELKTQQQKDKEEQERKEKLKSKVLEMGPKTKALVQNISELPKDKTLTKALLIRHAEINYEQIESHKDVVNDINFYDYIFNIKSELNRAKKDNLKFENELKAFNSELADLLITFQNIMVGAELLTKKPKDIYKEKNREAEKYLAELIEKIKEELSDKEELKKLKLYLDRFNEMALDLKTYDKLHEPSEYPLPINFEEAEYILEVVKEALERETGLIESIKACIKRYQNTISEKRSKNLIDKMEIMINKSNDKFNHEDIEFIENNLSQDVVGFFYDDILKKLSDKERELKKIKREWLNEYNNFFIGKKNKSDINHNIIHNALGNYNLFKSKILISDIIFWILTAFSLYFLFTVPKGNIKGLFLILIMIFIILSIYFRRSFRIVLREKLLKDSVEELDMEINKINCLINKIIEK